ncbi:XRE family transcriptional regulator [Nocardiopsis rhodophaea]|uniref:helix-turn-helix domain-containing protein n=1 Tax=Nocardiopsis rhodophaea TaxID=280238 RepID=UPI0031DF6EDC
MSDRAEKVSTTLAMNVRAVRQAKGWSLGDLAERADVSRGMLQQIETRKTNPSIATVARISEAVGLSVGQLIEPPADPGVISRDADVPVRPCGMDGRSEARLLVNDGRAPFVEVWDFRIAAQDEIHSPGHPVGTRELLTVTEGSLTVEVGSAEFGLGIGDALAMRGDHPHVYRNPGRTPTRLSMTVVYSGEQEPRFRSGDT